MRIEVLDFGINNTRSVTSAYSAFEGCEVEIVESAANSKGSNLLILPGVGNFGQAVSAIQARGFDAMIRDSAAKKTKILGICLGMQLLGTESEESPGVRGLDLIPGRTKKLPLEDFEYIPNVGWSGISQDSPEGLLSREIHGDFYFVHSYYFKPDSSENVIFSSNYGKFNFASGIQNENIAGVQFHPEKSSSTGHQFLKNSLEWAIAKN